MPDIVFQLRIKSKIAERLEAVVTQSLRCDYWLDAYIEIVMKYMTAAQGINRQPVGRKIQVVLDSNPN